MHSYLKKSILQLDTSDFTYLSLIYWSTTGGRAGGARQRMKNTCSKVLTRAERDYMLS